VVGGEADAGGAVAGVTAEVAELTVDVADCTGAVGVEAGTAGGTVTVGTGPSARASFAAISAASRAPMRTTRSLVPPAEIRI
jgi:hypothetical protein